MIFQPFARVVEKPFEDPAHRKDGRACIYRGAAGLNLPHLSAWCGGAFADDDFNSGARKIGRRR
jgi:hypothetical protein